MESVVSELEGTLLNDPDPFSYFMLLAFEASGLVRFVVLLIIWPIIRLLDMVGACDNSLKLMIFVATFGIGEQEIESVARAVLPKFFMDDIDMKAWKVFSTYDKRVVVTKMPRIMVERFVKEHLRADEVVGLELVVNRFGFATGFVENDTSSISHRISKLFVDEKPHLGMAKAKSNFNSFLSLCKEQMHTPLATIDKKDENNDQLLRPLPVIFHDGRLVKRPTPSAALLIILWIPFGIILATIRIVIGLILPLKLIPYISYIFGGKAIVKGKIPPPVSNKNVGVLFVCTHRTLMDPVVLSTSLGRKVPAVTYSVSRLSEMLSPIPTIRLTRIRDLDAEKIKKELTKGDLVVCPEGTTCREPFLLRFSSLFAELTDRIVPVAMNFKPSFFHATTARSWKGLDPFFFFMNPRLFYEVTFLNQLPKEATCSAGNNPHEVANYVQRILAATLRFECTKFTRKDKYRLLVGTDGTVSSKKNKISFFHHIQKMVSTFNH